MTVIFKGGGATGKLKGAKKRSGRMQLTKEKIHQRGGQRGQATGKSVKERTERGW